MKRLSLLFLCVCLTSSLFSQPLTEPEQKFFVQQMMNQQKSWNLADIDGYMSYYWGSDSLLFVTGDKVRKGWQNIRDNYEKKYPDSTAMGTLEYSKLFFYKIDKKKVFCTGSWAITRADGKLEGTFTLIWSKIKNRWVIIMDHTE